MMSDASFEQLRDARWAARRDLERARLRGTDDVDALQESVRSLTEELIGRYASSLDQLDALLEPAHVGVGEASR
jgi:hypothetical protein